VLKCGVILHLVHLLCFGNYFVLAIDVKKLYSQACIMCNFLVLKFNCFKTLVYRSHHTSDKTLADLSAVRVIRLWNTNA